MCGKRSFTAEALRARRPSDKKKLKRGSGYSLEGQWTYDNEGKMTSLTYPAKLEGTGPVLASAHANGNLTGMPMLTTSYDVGSKSNHNFGRTVMNLTDCFH